jgi:hypothetical protein
LICGVQQRYRYQREYRHPCGQDADRREFISDQGTKEAKGSGSKRNRQGFYRVTEHHSTSHMGIIELDRKVLQRWESYCRDVEELNTRLIAFESEIPR